MVQVHAGGQGVSALVVRVVAAQLRAPRRGEQQRLRVRPAGEDPRVLQHQIPQAQGGRVRVRAVHRLQAVSESPALQPV